MKILFILLLLIVGLLCLPVGGDIAYANGQLRLGIRIGPKVLWLYPGRFGKKGHKRKKTKKRKETEQDPAEKKKRPSLHINWDEVKAALDLFIRCVKKLRFRVRRLELWFVSGFPDPYDTAMAYGYANAAADALGLLRMKQADVQLSADFSADAPVYGGYLSITIRIYYLCKFGFTMAFGALRLLLRHRKRLKQEEKAKALIAGKEG